MWGADQQLELQWGKGKRWDAITAEPEPEPEPAAAAPPAEAGAAATPAAAGVALLMTPLQPTSSTGAVSPRSGGGGSSRGALFSWGTDRSNRGGDDSTPSASGRVGGPSFGGGGRVGSAEGLDGDPQRLNPPTSGGGAGGGRTRVSFDSASLAGGGAAAAAGAGGAGGSRAAASGGSSSSFLPRISFGRRNAGASAASGEPSSSSRRGGTPGSAKAGAGAGGSPSFAASLDGSVHRLTVVFRDELVPVVPEEADGGSADGSRSSQELPSRTQSDQPTGAAAEPAAPAAQRPASS